MNTPVDGGPRRLRDEASVRGRRRGALGCLTYGLGIGGLLVAAVAALGLLDIGPVHGALRIAALVLGLATFGAGAYLGALVDAQFNRGEVARHLPRVIVIDLLGAGVVLLLSLLGSLDSSAGGGHGGGSGTGGGGRQAPVRSNFASDLLDPRMAAGLLGVASVRTVSTGITTGTSSHALVMSVDSRGRTGRPSLGVTVWQGPAASRIWPGLRRGDPVAGPGEEAFLAADRVAFRRGDTVVQVHIRGFRGDGAQVLTGLALDADHRLTAPAAPPGA